MNEKLLGGKLLVAEPFMQDVYFKRSVVLLCENTKHSTFGYILNKRLNMKINELVRNFPDFDCDLYFGGPVQNDTLHFIHTIGDVLDESHEIAKGLFWGGNYNQLKVLVKEGLITPKDIKFFVNDLLMALKNFTPIFIPVNKHGRNSPEYVHKFEEIYASSDCLLLFPAGLVSRKQSGKGIQDLVWKKSFITKAIQYKKNVVPVFIDGHNSKFFYNLAYWRKRIGIKANLEMFYLVDEMYKQKGKTLTFTFGEPISWETFTKDHPAEYWSEKVKQHTYALQTKDKSKMLPTIKNNTVSK